MTEGKTEDKKSSQAKWLGSKYTGILFGKNLDEQVAHTNVVAAGCKDAVESGFGDDDQRQLVRVDIHPSCQRGNVVAEVVVADGHLRQQLECAGKGVVALCLLAAQDEDQLCIQCIVALVVFNQLIEDMLGRLLAFLQPERRWKNRL